MAGDGAERLPSSQRRPLRLAALCVAGLACGVAVFAPPAAARARRGAPECGTGTATWTTVFQLPAQPDRQRWLQNLWVMDSGELFAVGSVIVHCPPEQKCSVTELPEDHVLAAVWGTSASDVFAVGWRGLIMHFDGNSWAVQRAPAPRNRSSRGSHLFHIGAFLAGEIVAGLPAGPDAGSNTVLKRAGGVWQPVSHQEWSTLYDAHLGQPRSLGPCAHGIDLEWPGAYASGPAAAVVCRDNRRSFWKEDGRWVPHGRAKGVCNSRGASFMDSVRSGNAWIVGCHREGLEETTIWKNEGDSWSPECSIDQTVWRFIATAHSIYAVGDRIILRRSLPPRAE